MPNLSWLDAFRRVSLPGDWSADRRKQLRICKDLKSRYQPRTSWWWRQDSNLQPTAIARWLVPIEPQVRRETHRELRFARQMPMARLHPCHQPLASRSEAPPGRCCHRSFLFLSGSPSVARLASIGECRRQVCLWPGNGGRADI